jgi:hypothetical protein
MRERYDCFSGIVEVDGQTILDVTTAGIQPVVGAGAFVKYSPTLDLAIFEKSSRPVQLEASYEFKRVLRGRPQLTTFDAERLGGGGLQPTLPIAGSHARVNIVLHPVRYLIDPAVSVEDGGTGKL